MKKPVLCGWAVSIRDKTLHYFVDYRALCGGVTFYAWPSAGRTYEHCHDCISRLEAHNDSSDDQRLVGTVRSRLGGPTVSVDVDDLIAEARSDEKPGSVPPPAASSGLRLLCLLCQKTGAYQPVATLRPMPPRTLFSGRWPNAAGERALATCEQYVSLGLGLYLSPALTNAAPTSVLVHGGKHRQANALRPALGSVRAGV